MVNKMKTNLLFLATSLFILYNHHCSSNVTNEFEDPKDILYRELSVDAYFSLPSHEPGDTAVSLRRTVLPREHFNEVNWLKTADYQFMRDHDQPALKWGPQGQVVDTDFYNTYQPSKSPDTLNPDAFTILHLCYAISYIWRRGRKGIHRYYNLRDIYYDHLPFEIGYMTQVIMAKYQNVLELYEYSTRMEEGNKMGRPHLYFFYKNILEECRNIIHLCNMIHEVTRKYRELQYSENGATWIPVVYDPAQKFQDPAGFVYNKKYPNDHRQLRQKERGIEGFEYEKHFHNNPKKLKIIKEAAEEQENERIREYQLQKKQRNHFIEHGHFAMTSPSSRRTRRWRSNQPLEYGWDPDNNK